MKNSYMPAMPQPVSISVNSAGDVEFISSAHEQEWSGLTKREAFAMAAMQGICGDGIPGSHHMPEQTARDAVAQADALLKELENEVI